jgi:hypothetical protein
MTGQTGAVEATLISPVTGIRIKQNSGSGATTLQIVQGGRESSNEFQV